MHCHPMSDGPTDRNSTVATKQASGKRVIFTLTTFLSLPGKLDQCLNAIDSLVRAHGQEWEKIDRFILVNECLHDGEIGYKDIFSGLFPWLDFIQKEPNQRGQVASLNMILDEIVSYDYWIHWEESWVCRTPFLHQSIQIMETTSITQLQISTDIWQEMGPERITCKEGPDQTRYAEVVPDPLFLRIRNALNTANFRSM